MESSASCESTDTTLVKPFSTILKTRKSITVQYEFDVPPTLDERLTNLLTNTWYYIYLSGTTTRTKIYEHLLTINPNVKRCEMKDIQKHIKVSIKKYTSVTGHEEKGGIVIKKE